MEKQREQGAAGLPSGSIASRGGSGEGGEQQGRGEGSGGRGVGDPQNLHFWGVLVCRAALFGEPGRLM